MSLKAVSNVINKCLLHFNKQCQKSHECLCVLQCFSEALLSDDMNESYGKSRAVQCVQKHRCDESP